MINEDSPARFEIIDRSQLADYPHDLFVSYCVDCACTVSPKSLPSPLTSSTYERQQPVCMTPELRFDALSNDYWAVFNPTGAMGIVILSRLSLNLLNIFKFPVTSTNVLQKYTEGMEDIDEIQQTITRLMQLDLIRPVNAEPTYLEETAHHLLTAWLTITNACTLKCTYCYVEKNQEHMSETTGKAAIDAIIRTALTENYPAIRLKYAGGEASLRLNTVFTLHDYAVNRCQEMGIHLQAVLLTNGVALRSEGVLGLKERAIEVMVSLDSVDDDQSMQRPYLSEQSSTVKVMEGIDQLIAHDLLPHVTITVTDQNSIGIVNVVRHALANNLKFSLNFRDDRVRTQDDVGEMWEEFKHQTVSLGLERHFRLNSRWRLIAGASVNRLA